MPADRAPDPRAPAPRPPGELRPAQLGIVLLGRVIVGHAGATIADLARRGVLRIDEVPGAGDPDWLLTDRRDQAPGAGPLLPFETALLAGLFARPSAVRLSEISPALVPALNQFRAQVRRDAVRHGRLRRWRGGQRTPAGEQLLREI